MTANGLLRVCLCTGELIHIYFFLLLLTPSKISIEHRQYGSWYLRTAPTTVRLSAPYAYVRIGIGGNDKLKYIEHGQREQ